MASAADDFRVRPYDGADKGAVLELLRQVWAHKRHLAADFQDRWWWQWAQPPLYVVEGPQRALAGLCAYIPFTLRARGREFSSAWFVDFYVLQECQGRGLGRRLTQAVQERFAITASLSQTAMAWRVFQKMGWHERTRVTLYMNPFPAPWTFRRPPPAVRISTHPIAAGLPVAADLDRLWARVRDRYQVIACRDSASILRRYTSQGDRRYVLLCGHQGEQCAGYMIVRAVRSVVANSRRAEGLVVDYLVHPEDRRTFAALLGQAVSVLRDEGAGRMYCISSSPRCQRALAAHGFLSPAAPLVGRLLRGNTKWLTYYSRADAGPIDPAAWFLTIGDCDIDYAWHRE